ncbi:MAG: HAMP domain-containing protein [Candidatus Omnitrophica bacterium]|nr:HAMP domain-containing protein [Candidatus Omnitrophota bacterium]
MTDLNYRLSLGKNFLESQLSSQNILPDPINLANQIGKEQNLRATIISPDGVVLGDSDLSAEEIKNVENHLHRPEIQEALKNGGGKSTRYSKTIRKYLLYMAVCLKKEKLAGFLRYALPVSYIDILKGEQTKIIIASLILVFLLSLSFTFVISLVVSRPLVEMGKIAQEMAKGNFSKKPDPYGQDEMGDLARALSYMSDEVKDKLDLLKQETVKLDTVLSSMFEGVMVVNEKGRIILMNLSLRKLFLIDFEPENKAAIEVIRNPQIHDILEGILNKKQQIISEEIDITQPREKILRINAVPIMKNEKIIGAVLVCHDITEIRRLEKIRQDFMANVSHELRTPVTCIKGYAETLLDGGLEDKERSKEFVNTILQNSNRLETLISDLLDLAVIESNKMKMVFSPLDIKPVLERSLGVFKKSMQDKKISLTIKTSENLPKIMADDKRLTQVFVNLLDNAVKYTMEGGAIKIEISCNNNMLQVDIADTGIGIPEKDLPRIFERFYRVDKSRSRELGGTGLGLSIVKHLILSHKGQIWVQSTQGQGSTFSFSIPHI